jgi:hypothetical protein
MQERRYNARARALAAISLFAAAAGCSLLFDLEGDLQRVTDASVAAPDTARDVSLSDVMGDAEPEPLGCPPEALGVFCEDFDDALGRTKLEVDSIGSGNRLESVQDAGSAFSQPGFLRFVAAEAGHYRVTAFKSVRLGATAGRFEARCALRAIATPSTRSVLRLNFGATSVVLGLGGTTVRLSGNAYVVEPDAGPRDGGPELVEYSFTGPSLGDFAKWYQVSLEVDLAADTLSVAVDGQRSVPYALRGSSRALTFGRTTGDPTLVVGPGAMNATPYLEYHVDDVLLRTRP